MKCRYSTAYFLDIIMSLLRQPKNLLAQEKTLRHNNLLLPENDSFRWLVNVLTVRWLHSDLSEIKFKISKLMLDPFYCDKTFAPYCSASNGSILMRNRQSIMAIKSALTRTTVVNQWMKLWKNNEHWAARRCTLSAKSGPEEDKIGLDSTNPSPILVLKTG